MFVLLLPAKVCVREITYIYTPTSTRLFETPTAPEAKEYVQRLLKGKRQHSRKGKVKGRLEGN